MGGKNENDRDACHEKVPIHLNIPINIQSTLVISTSVLSNNRLSPGENLVHA